jgi:hypothetical protein
MNFFVNRNSAPVWTLLALMTKTGRSGELREARVAERDLAIALDDPLADRRTRRQHAADDRAGIDRRRRDLPNQRDDEVREVRRDAAFEAELVPPHPEHARRQRAARNAGNAVEPGQILRVVQIPEHAEVKEHGAIASAGETERQLVPKLLFRTAVAGQRNRFDAVGHDGPPPEGSRMAAISLPRDRVSSSASVSGLHHGTRGPLPKAPPRCQCRTLLRRPPARGGSQPFPDSGSGSEHRCVRWCKLFSIHQSTQVSHGREPSVQVRARRECFRVQ